MTGMKKWMLGAAMVAGAALLGAPPAANAARVGIYIGTSAAYVPPCPGPGYAWADGYYANGYWVPGSWNYVGVEVGAPIYGGRAYFDRDRDWYRDNDRRRDFDRDRRFDDHRFDRDDHRSDRDDHFRR